MFRLHWKYAWIMGTLGITGTITKWIHQRCYTLHILADLFHALKHFSHVYVFTKVFAFAAVDYNAMKGVAHWRLIWVNLTDLCRPACSVAVTVIEGTTWAAWSPRLSDVPKPLGAASTAWRITPQSRQGNWMLPKQWRKSTQKCGRRTGMLELPSMYMMTFYFMWLWCSVGCLCYSALALLSCSL